MGMQRPPELHAVCICIQGGRGHVRPTSQRVQTATWATSERPRQQKLVTPTASRCSTMHSSQPLACSPAGAWSPRLLAVSGCSAALCPGAAPCIVLTPQQTHSASVCVCVCVRVGPMAPPVRGGRQVSHSQSARGRMTRGAAQAGAEVPVRPLRAGGSLGSRRHSGRAAIRRPRIKAKAPARGERERRAGVDMTWAGRGSGRRSGLAGSTGGSTSAKPLARRCYADLPAASLLPRAALCPEP